MLHYQTLQEKPYHLLRELMQNQTLQDAGFILCGGTSLALQLGHRMSTDLDIFSTKNVGPAKLKEFMEKTFGNRLEILSEGDLGFRGYLDGVKIDMIRFPYALQHPVVVNDGIRLLNIEDGAAMKIHAIANRGARRDYIDLGEILQKIPMQKVLANYQQQFNPSPLAMNHTKRAITFFSDAEKTSPHIEVLNGRTWNQTKSIIEQSLKNAKSIILKPAPKQLVANNPYEKLSSQKLLINKIKH